MIVNVPHFESLLVVLSLFCLLLIATTPRSPR